MQESFNSRGNAMSLFKLYNGHNIISYNIDELIDDLKYIIYTQNYIEPWIDPKYLKRIVRIIILIVFKLGLYKMDDNIKYIYNNFINFMIFCKKTYTCYKNTNEYGKLCEYIANNFLNITIDGKSYVNNLKENIMSYIHEKKFNSSFLET